MSQLGKKKKEKRKKSVFREKTVNSLRYLRYSRVGTSASALARLFDAREFLLSKITEILSAREPTHREITLPVATLLSSFDFSQREMTRSRRSEGLRRKGGKTDRRKGGKEESRKGEWNEKGEEPSFFLAPSPSELPRDSSSTSFILVIESTRSTTLSLSLSLSPSPSLPPSPPLPLDTRHRARGVHARVAVSTISTSESERAPAKQKPVYVGQGLRESGRIGKYRKARSRLFLWPRLLVGRPLDSCLSLLDREGIAERGIGSRGADRVGLQFRVMCGTI